MKYLKTFENKKLPKYKIGDYIIMNDVVIDENDLIDNYNNIGIVIDVKHCGDKKYMYDVNYLNDKFEFENIKDHYVIEYEIVDKAPQDEIDYINSVLLSKKYNL